MKLNHSKLKSFFIGTLLGDSYIHNGVFYCKQISKDLIYFKASIIKKYLPGVKLEIKEYDEYTDINNVHHQKFWVLSASKHKYIKKLEQTFYKNGKKIYPSKSILKLDSLGFAMWYADDGTSIIVQHGRSRRVQICTDNFTQEEQTQIKNELESLGYTIKLINRRRNNQYRIQFNSISNQKLICEIADYFYKYFPSLLYKMDLGYRGDSLNKESYVSPEYKACYIKISAHPEFKDRLSDDIV